MRSDQDRQQDPDWRAEIAVLEEEANDAYLRRDVARLDQLFADDLLVDSPLNTINDKRKLLELLGNGVIGHVSTTIQHELIRRDGELVIVMGSDAARTSPSEPIVRRRFTNVWRREGDRWRLWVRHANVIATDSRARS
jgi:ketosteroid isomerase-like protein